MKKEFNLVFFFTLSVLLLLSLPAAGTEQGFALKAGKIFTSTGEAIENGVIVVKGGKILGVGTGASVSKEFKVIERPDAVVVPGFVDIHTSLGAYGFNREGATAVEPQVRALDLFDPNHRDFQLALAEGITTVLIVPSDQNIVGGMAAAIKTGGKSIRKRVLLKEGPLKCSLSSSTYRSDRFPTSRMGALHLFRNSLTCAMESKSAAAGTCPLKKFAQGEIAGLIRCGHSSEITAAAAFAKEFNLRAVLVTSALLEKSLEDAVEAKTPLLLGPLGFNSPPRLLRDPALAHKAGLPVAFTSNAPAGHPATLRLSAALSMRYGLDAPAALLSITRIPADLAGLGKRIGSLEEGKDADFVILSGHPLDPASRVLEVYIDGERVFHSCCCPSKSCCNKEG